MLDAGKKLTNNDRNHGTKPSLSMVRPVVTSSVSRGFALRAPACRATRDECCRWLCCGRTGPKCDGCPPRLPAFGHDPFAGTTCLSICIRICINNVKVCRCVNYVCMDGWMELCRYVCMYVCVYCMQELYMYIYIYIMNVSMCTCVSLYICTGIQT